MTSETSPYPRVRITWVRSTINRREVHKRTVRALGLRRLNQSRELTLTPQVKGMLAQVCHLVKVERLGEP